MKQLILWILVAFLTAIIILHFLDLSRRRRSAAQPPREGYTTNYMQDAVLKPYNTTKTITKITDTIYFDNTNGNLIEAVYDSSGISFINVLPRNVDTTNPVSTIYDNSEKNTTESLVASMPRNINASWTYKDLAGVYEITYTTVEQDTVIHVMNIVSQSPTLILTAYMTDPAADNMTDYHLWTDVSGGSVGQPLTLYSGSYLGSTSSADGTNVSEPYYDSNKVLYQLSQYVKYDNANGNLCIEGRDDSGLKLLNVYSRSGARTIYDASNNAATTSDGKTPSSKVLTLSTNIQKPMLLHDDLGTNIIIYFPYLKKTIITEYKGVLDSDNSGVSILRTLTLTNSAVIKSASTAPPPTITTTTTTPPPSFDVSGMQQFIRDTIGASETSVSDDYILKTQIVPITMPAPVCTVCPSTAATDTTTTSTTTSSNALERAGSAIHQDIRGVGSFVGDAIEETAKTAKNAGAYVGTGVGNFVAKLTDPNRTVLNTGGGSVNLPPTVNSAANMGGAAGTYRANPYSFGGQINSQYDSTTNVVPITADFSKFGR